MLISYLKLPIVCFIIHPWYFVHSADFVILTFISDYDFVRVWDLLGNLPQANVQAKSRS